MIVETIVDVIINYHAIMNICPIALVFPYLSSPPPPRSFPLAIFLAVFNSISRSRSLLRNRTETLATQAQAANSEMAYFPTENPFPNIP